MKKEHILAIKSTLAILILIIFSSFISYFLFSNITSISDYFWFLKIEFWKNFSKLLNAFFAFLIIWFWTYLIVYFYWKNYFKKVEKYNENLKNYNHYLAHELKTPISVIFSNLEVLKYWFNEEIIKNSEMELKNMVSIIDILLTFSETVNINEKEDLNLENLLKSYISKYFYESKNKIFITNKEFNFYIETNLVLFKRVIRNLLENALKYSLDWDVFIKIENNKIIFENSIEKDFSKEELEKLTSKFYRKENQNKNGFGLGLNLIKEILNFLNYDFKLFSENKKFIAEINFKK